MQYRKKPVVVEARELTTESMWDVWDWIGDETDEWCWDKDEMWISIKTLEGVMKARAGDWIIKGVKGEFYPCKPDIFALTYEPADTPNHAATVAALREAAEGALHALESSRVFVTSRERCHKPDGEAWYDERVAKLRAALKGEP